MARTRAQRRQRKLRNQAKMKALLERTGTGPPRIRRSFFAKARSGDAAELSFTFSGEPVLIDPARPTESAIEVLALIASVEGQPAKGEA